MEGQDNLSPRYIKAKVEVRIEAIAKEIIRTGIGQATDGTIGIEESSGKIEIDTDSGKAIEEIVSETTPEGIVDKIAEENIGIIVIEMMAKTEVGTGLEKDHFQGIMTIAELGVQAIVN